MHPLPITIFGYRTWLLTSSLDSFCEPFSLVAVPEINQKAKLYKVRFIGSIPDFASYGLQVIKSPEGNVICMSTEKFWEIEARSLCIPLSSTKWKAKSLFYHSLTALFHLGIIPTLSENTFLTITDLSKYELDLNAQYGTDAPLNESLHYIFKTTIFSLTFFGFAEIPPSDIKTQEYFEYAKKLMEYDIEEYDTDTNKYFAFAQIAFALTNYNKKCQSCSGSSTSQFLRPSAPFSDETNNDNSFMIDQSSQFLSGYSYKLLMRSVSAVTHLLAQLGYNITDNASLIKVVLTYQAERRTVLKPTGICDSSTLRYLWKESISNSMTLPVIFDKTGFLQLKKLTPTTSSERNLFIENDVANYGVPIHSTSRAEINHSRNRHIRAPLPLETEDYRSSYKTSDVLSEEYKSMNQKIDERESLRSKMNYMIARIPDLHTYELSIDHKVLKDLNEVTMDCVALNQRIEGIHRRMEASKKLIQHTAEMNTNCDQLLQQALKSLNDILQSHMKAQEKFEEIRNYISIQSRTNHILTFCGIFFLLFYFIRTFHIFSSG